MKLKKTTFYIVRIALLLFALYSMFIWVGSYPYVEAGIHAYGIKYELNRDAIPTLQILSAIGFVVNAGLAVLSKGKSKSFFIIHLVLAELCLAHTLTLFFV